MGYNGHSFDYLQQYEEWHNNSERTISRRAAINMYEICLKTPPRLLGFNLILPRRRLLRVSRLPFELIYLGSLTPCSVESPWNQSGTMADHVDSLNCALIEMDRDRDKGRCWREVTPSNTSLQTAVWGDTNPVIKSTCNYTGSVWWRRRRTQRRRRSLDGWMDGGIFLWSKGMHFIWMVVVAGVM